MKSANAYQDQINQILGIKVEDGEKMQWDVETAADAAIALTDIQTTTTRLEQIRRELNDDSKAIYDDYREKIANPAAGKSAAMSLLGRKQQAGQIKANAKRQLRAKRNEELAPYNEVKDALDRILVDLEKQATLAGKILEEEQAAPSEAVDEAEVGQELSLTNFYFDTPPAGSQLSFAPEPFSVPEPRMPREESSFLLAKPAEPQLLETGLKGLFSASRRQEVEQENQRLRAEYKQQVQAWEEARAAAESETTQSETEYQERVAAWQQRKEAYESAEVLRIQELEEARQKDPSTMHSLLGRQLDGLSWPAELEMEFATNYRIGKGGQSIRLEVRLPAEDELADDLARTKGIDYVTLVHAIGFRLAGHAFYTLPVIQQLLLNGYIAESADATHLEARSYLYSCKIQRAEWSQVDFDILERLDVVACFNLFDIRRGLIGEELAPIKPFSR